MTHHYTFLLVSDANQTPWTLFVQTALSSLGLLHFTTPENAVETAKQQPYDVMLLDARGVRDTVALIHRLREQRPNARIIVATASPTWQDAREVIKAGAIDYIHKSTSEKGLQASVKAALKIPSR